MMEKNVSVRGDTMEICYLGTGADDWVPEEGEKNGEYRRRSAATLDGVLSLDLPSTTPLEPLALVREVLYTHSHRDHFDLCLLSRLVSDRPLTVYMETSFSARIAGEMPRAVTVRGIMPGETFTTETGFRVTALAANHRVAAYPEEQPLAYVIERGDCRIFWGGDGAWLRCDTWARLRQFPQFDRMVLDGTLWEKPGDGRIFEHNHLGMVREMAATFRREGLIKPNGKIVLNHFSRDSQYPRAELESKVAEMGLFAAYDGLIDRF